jgi:hypothetical protein
MKSADEPAVIEQSHNGVSQLEDNLDGLHQQNVVATDTEAIALKNNPVDVCTPPAELGEGVAFQASDDLAALGQNGSCQLWLYKCVLDGCNAAFELLADLRTHFICHHLTAGIFLSRFYRFDSDLNYTSQAGSAI